MPPSPPPIRHALDTRQLDADDAYVPCRGRARRGIIVVYLAFASLTWRGSEAFCPAGPSGMTVGRRGRLRTEPISCREIHGTSLLQQQLQVKESKRLQNHYRHGQRHRRRDILSVPQMAVEGDFDPTAVEQNRLAAKDGSVKARLRAVYKFTRPHTIRGTILASVAGTVRALVDTPGAVAGARWGVMLPRAVLGMVALLLGNAYIVGINQIFDKDIDVLNKPFLPVASGEMSTRTAWIAVAASAVVGPALVHRFFPPVLFYLYALGMVLGTAYSVPPVRTKRNPVLAGLTIATVRGFLLNFGVYYAVKDAVGATFAWSPKVSFIARFMTVFATIIAVTKDLPDVEGDKAYQIETFATKIGVSKIAKLASVGLLLNYVHAIATGLVARPGTFHAVPMVGGHAALALLLLARFRELDAESIPSIKKYYKHIWDLFYLEYVLYALI